MTCVYNKNLALQIVDHCGLTENRTVNLILINNQQALQIKMRDPSEYTFNYNETIDLGDYEIIRAKQNLDINFNDFITNLLEMLQQVQKREMLLRCESSEKMCTLVFYNKSKIKSIIYLTLDLHPTAQKEILSEVMNNMQYIKESNERLQQQLSNMKKIVTEKDKETKRLNCYRSQMESQFYEFLKEVEVSIISKSKDVECLFVTKIKIIMQRVASLLEEVNTLKKETVLKNDSSKMLFRNVENLKAENTKKNMSIEQLKQENNELHNTQKNLEKNLASLRTILNERDISIRELQKNNEELKSDMKKATIIIAQKSSSMDELRKDLIQANQMLVNFNNHYDQKVETIENLQATLVTKSQIIDEEKRKNYELQKEFDGYKIVFNSDTQDKLKHELLLAQNKIDELEKSIRNVKKINSLLSEKVNRIGM